MTLCDSTWLDHALSRLSELWYSLLMNLNGKVIKNLTFCKLGRWPACQLAAQPSEHGLLVLRCAWQRSGGWFGEEALVQIGLADDFPAVELKGKWQRREARVGSLASRTGGLSTAGLAKSRLDLILASVRL